MKKIIIMSEYNCYPLWEKKEDGLSNFEAYELNIPKDLAKKIEDWGDIFEATYVSDDPSISGFSGNEQRQAFIDLGKDLSRELHLALGQGFEVEYRILGKNYSQV